MSSLLSSSHSRNPDHELTLDGRLRAGGRDGTQGADHEVREKLIPATAVLAHVVAKVRDLLLLAAERALVGRPGGVEPGGRRAECAGGHRAASGGPRQRARCGGERRHDGLGGGWGGALACGFRFGRVFWRLDDDEVKFPALRSFFWAELGCRCFRAKLVVA